MAVDAANQRTFLRFRLARTYSYRLSIQILSRPKEEMMLPEVGGDPVSLRRWGTNGLAFTTVPTIFPGASRVYLHQTELVSNAAPMPTEFSLRKFFVRRSTPTISIKVARTGDITGTASINFATSDGTTAGSDLLPPADAYLRSRRVE